MDKVVAMQQQRQHVNARLLCFLLGLGGRCVQSSNKKQQYNEVSE
jgi:hypothetical protein